MILIYRVTNLANGKIYIGQTSKSLTERWEQHVYQANRVQHYFKRAIKKYGPESFVIQKIDSAESPADASFLETFHIVKSKSYFLEVGYNSTLGGEHGAHTEEVREKISRARKGKPGTPWTAAQREKMIASHTGENNHFYGKSHSEETKLKISASRTGKGIGRVFSDERRQKLRLAATGRTHSDEAKKKISEARKGKRHTQEWKDNMSVLMKNRVFTPEHRRRLSLGNMKRIVLKGRKITSEHKQKISETKFLKTVAWG